MQFVLSATNALFFVLSSVDWRSGKRDIAISAGGLGFDRRAGQIKAQCRQQLDAVLTVLGVGCCVAQKINRGNGPPATRYRQPG